MEKIEVSRVLLPMHTYLQSHLGHPIECSCVSIGDTVGHKSTAGFWLRARFICNSQDILTDPRIYDERRRRERKWSIFLLL